MSKIKQLSEEQISEIITALKDQRLYNPYNVFTHSPEYYECEDERYLCEIRIVKWNTKSTRMTVLYARKRDDGKMVFARKTGQKRLPHGEKMR